MTEFVNAPIPVVRTIIPDSENRVLILKRQNSTHGNGQWCLPGGKVEYGDTLEETAVKELKEETSLNCLAIRYLFVEDRLPAKNGDMHCIDHFFVCDVEGAVLLNEESCEFAWIGKSELPHYDIAFQQEVDMLRYWDEGSSCDDRHLIKQTLTD